MTESADKAQSAGNADKAENARPHAPPPGREERLAAKLRENLQKRKSQARSRRDAGDAPE